MVFSFPNEVETNFVLQSLDGQFTDETTDYDAMSIKKIKAIKAYKQASDEERKLSAQSDLTFDCMLQDVSSEKSDLTLFYMGFWRYVNTWGGQIDPPLLKARKMIQTW